MTSFTVTRVYSHTEGPPLRETTRESERCLPRQRLEKANQDCVPVPTNACCTATASMPRHRRAQGLLQLQRGARLAERGRRGRAQGRIGGAGFHRSTGHPPQQLRVHGVLAALRDSERCAIVCGCARLVRDVPPCGACLPALS